MDGLSANWGLLDLLSNRWSLNLWLLNDGGGNLLLLDSLWFSSKGLVDSSLGDIFLLLFSLDWGGGFSWSGLDWSGLGGSFGWSLSGDFGEGWLVFGLGLFGLSLLDWGGFLRGLDVFNDDRSRGLLGDLWGRFDNWLSLN